MLLNNFFIAKCHGVGLSQVLLLAKNTRLGVGCPSISRPDSAVLSGTLKEKALAPSLPATIVRPSDSRTAVKSRKHMLLPLKKHAVVVFLRPSDGHNLLGCRIKLMRFVGLRMLLNFLEGAGHFGNELREQCSSVKLCAARCSNNCETTEKKFRCCFWPRFCQRPH